MLTKPRRSPKRWPPGSTDSLLSTTVIQRSLSLLILDATDEHTGSEADISTRLQITLSKRGLPFAAPSSIAIASPADLSAHDDVLASASCVVVLGSTDAHPGLCLGIWNALANHDPTPKLAIACQFGAHDPTLTDTVLNAASVWAPIAIAPQSPVGHRDGGLFLLKFLTEVQLHSGEQITGRMAWFSWKKAGELLKRRSLVAQFGLRT